MLSWAEAVERVAGYSGVQGAVLRPSVVHEPLHRGAPRARTRCSSR
jgi:hypothetical protein